MDAEMVMEIIKGFQAIHGKSVGVKIAGCEITSISVAPAEDGFPAYIDIVGR